MPPRTSVFVASGYHQNKTPVKREMRKPRSAKNPGFSVVLAYTHHQGFGVQGLCRGSGRAGSPVMGIYREKQAFRVPSAVQRLGGSQRSDLGRRGKRGTNSASQSTSGVLCHVPSFLRLC